MNTINTDDDLILYHYTTIEGAHGIFQSGKVWASDCLFLNDRHELHRAIEVFLSMFDGETHKALSWAIHGHKITRHHCIFSLSNSPEVLSQWRAYADDGRGAAIGFSTKYIARRASASSIAPSVLVDCLYEDHEGFLEGIKISHEKQIEDILKVVKDHPAANDFLSVIKASPEALDSLFDALLRIKNPAFSEEKEARLIFHTPSQQTKTRVTKGLVIPYIEHEFAKDKFDFDGLSFIAPQIWLGPKCDERNIAAFEAFHKLGWNRHGIKGGDLNLGIFRYDCGYL